MEKKMDFSEGELRKFDLRREYGDDFSPAGGISWRDHALLYAIGGMMLIFIVWANFATLQEVVRGEGRIIPSSEVQVIQNLEGGIVEEISVQEGQVVDAGQRLARLSNVQAKSDYEANNKKYYSLLATVIRLQGEADGNTPQFPADVTAAAPESVSAEKAAFEANRQQAGNQQAVLQEQLKQRQQEITELKKRIASAENVLSISQEEHDMVKPMVARGSASKQELLQLDRDIARQRSELEQSVLSLPRAEAAAKEAEERLNEQRSNLRAEARRQLSGHIAEMNALKETLSALKDRSQRTEVLSPVHGTVKDIKIKTVGGVVRPGEEIMEVVPLEDQLIVESRVKPSDIAFVYPGQPAVVRVSAYDFSIYGALHGKVVEVSPDSIATEKGESFYHVKIRTDETKLRKGNKQLSIIPGMQATVDFVSGEKTIMKYILKPFIKTSQMAMTER